MAAMGEDIRERTDALDAAGNTTAAIGKGYAIGSAALVSLALFGAYVTRADISVKDSSILDPEVHLLAIIQESIVQHGRASLGSHCVLTPGYIQSMQSAGLLVRAMLLLKLSAVHYTPTRSAIAGAGDVQRSAYTFTCAC